MTIKIGTYTIELPETEGRWYILSLAVNRIHLIMNWFVGFAVVLAVGFIIYSGIQFMTSAGDAEKMVAARKMLTAAIVGMVIVLVSRVIILFFVDTFLAQ